MIPFLREIKVSEANPIIEVAGVKLLNVPRALALIQEIVEQDCYKLDLIPDGSLVFDVGAFYWEFGLLCAHAKGCKVVAYEPSIENFRIASANYVINEYLPFVDCRLLLAAIGGKAEADRTFYSRPHHPAGSGFGDWGDGVLESVRCLTLSEEIAFLDPAWRHGRPICVKLDCEGAEVEIFQDDPYWIDMVDIVAMEWHNHDGEHFAGILEAHGFKVTLESSGPHPCQPYDKSMTGGMIFATKQP